MTPQFQSVSAFFAMGGHAPYVWGAWGLSVLVILALCVAVIRSQRHWRRRLAELEALTAAAGSSRTGSGQP